MYWHVENFHKDIGEWANKPLPVFFDHVKNMAYQRDPKKGKEVLARPGFLLAGLFPAIDCKKKAILIASWLRANHIPYRFIAVSERPDKRIHHVMVQAEDGGKWVNLDATYPNYKFQEPKPKITRAQELERA